jgi:two-component sensor histidine kinase
MSEKPILYTLRKAEKHYERLRDLHEFFSKGSRTIAAGALVLGTLSFFIPALPKVISFTVFALAILTTFNLWMYNRLQRLKTAGTLLALITLLSSIVVMHYSGGIFSPFLFVLMIICFIGYTVSITMGVLLLIGLAVGITLSGLGVFDLIGLEVKDISPIGRLYFTVLTILFSIFIIMASVGGELRRLLQRLYAEKYEVENRLNEKEILLKEVHHRVKNNLQTVSSLLRMQGRNIEDQGTLHLIQSSQNRVVAMAMVHEMLYMREDLAKIDYRTYVTELGGYLIKSLKGPESKITLRIDIPQIELGIDTAIPLGLLINEAVTNALKYGFKDRETGEISILLERESKTEYVLRIGDNGVGYPESITHKSTKSLGLKLIYNLSRQLQGSVIRDLSKEGTNYIIRFHELNPSSFHSLA